MPTNYFHEKPFDEATITKLQIFELYVREWLPVFLSQDRPRFKNLHIYDFFAGSGTDSTGLSGSPLRLLHQLIEYKHLAGWCSIKIVVHFYDKELYKITRLKGAIESYKEQLPEVVFDVQHLKFAPAFDQATPFLNDPASAKLIFLDQFGVDIITPEVFKKLIGFPQCDFLFFIASSTLYRFFEDPAIKQKIAKPADYYSCHRATFEYYKNLIPEGNLYFLAPFSIKKGSNIYGLVFGSAHPLGISKFLSVAWKNDEIYGEANFDIDRQDILPGQTLLTFDGAPPIRKLAAFEADLEAMLRDGQLRNELDVMIVCFEHGVRPQHSREVLLKLKRARVLHLNFHVPDVSRWNDPRPITLLK